MSPVYRHGEGYPQPSPAYYWAPPSVEPVPNWESREPYYYYREAPPWRPWHDERSSYGYRPAEGGYYYYGPKYGNPRYYERDSRGFGRDFSRDFMPVYVVPPPPAGAYDYRPFHPSDHFRHPDEYPMRFVPATNGSLHRPEIEQAKRHCCGCPNHECHSETKPVQEIERKKLTDGKSEEALTTKPQKLQEFPGPIMCFPSEWKNTSSDSKDGNEEKHPLCWVPVNWNRNDREPEQEKRCPGYWIPLDSKSRPQGWEGDKNTFPQYWIPVDSIPISQGQEEDKKYSPNVGKLQSFPVLWVPERDLKSANSEEDTKSANLAVSPEEATKTNGADSRPVIVEDDKKQRPVEAKKETKTRDIPVKQLDEEKLGEAPKRKEKATENQKASSPRASNLPVKAETIKKTKARDIPVKQLDEEKPAEAPKIREKVTENHKASSPRAAKLPPVCLRVDPLPKKKSSGNNSSRSPSGKAESTMNNATSKREANAPSQASVEHVKHDASEVSMELREATENAKLKTSEFANQTKKTEKNRIAKASDVSGEARKVEEDAQLKTSKSAGEDKNGENLNVQNKEAGAKESELDRDQAALKIQAFYRGWQVRRLQPVRKLREIAKIRERVEELKEKISRPEFEVDLAKDDKTKVRMSETLMGVLLQLDTIQGLHPVIRDVRKSVARQLVHLQEKLDTLVKEASTGNLEPSSRELAKNDLQPNSKELGENNVTSEEEKIEDKRLGATQDSGKILLNTNSENQQDENERHRVNENSLEADSPHIENEMNNGDRAKVSLEREADDGKEKASFELENATSKYEEVEDKVPQEDTLAKEASTGNLELSSKELAENDSQSSSTEFAETNMTSEDVKIEYQDRSMGATQDSGKTLNTNFENQQDEHEIERVDENSLEADSPLIENKMTNGDKVKASLEKEADDGKENASFELKNATTKYEELEDKVTLKQEALQVSNLEIPNLSMDLQDETGNQDEYPANEPEQIISTANDAEMSLENIIVEKEEKSDPPLVKGEKPEHNNMKEPDSALPQESDTAIGNEIHQSSTLVQEPAVANVENSKTLHENLNASGENATVKQGEELTVVVPEAQPGKGISNDKIAVFDSEGNRTESVEEQNSVREEIVGDNNSELSTQSISEGLSGSHSHVTEEETNMIEVESLPVSDNSTSVKGEFAALVPQKTNTPRTDESIDAGITGDSRENGEFTAVATHETDIPRTEGFTDVALTGDGFSAVKHENGLSIQTEEHPPKFSGLSVNIDSGTSGMVGKLVSESESSTLNKIYDAHSENAGKTGVNISKQDHENWEEENEKLREMVEKLVAAGKNQMSTIAQLNDKIRCLENKLNKGKGKRKARARQLKLKSNIVAGNTKSAAALGC